MARLLLVLASTSANAEREGRNYSPYLAKKTLDKKAKYELPKKLRCPKCHRLFLKLDTHLRKNPFCKSVKDHEKLLTCEPHFQPLFNNHSETIPPTSLLIDSHSPTHAPSTELTNGQLQLEPLSHNGHFIHNIPKYTSTITITDLFTLSNHYIHIRRDLICYTSIHISRHSNSIH